MAPFLRTDEGEGAEHGAFLSPYFRQENPLLRYSRRSPFSVAFTPARKPRGWFVSAVRRRAGGRAGETEEKDLQSGGWVSRSCAKDGWQNGGISFYYASSLGTGLSIRSEELPYRSPKNGTPWHGKEKEFPSRSLIVDTKNDVFFLFYLDFSSVSQIYKYIIALLI